MGLPARAKVTLAGVAIAGGVAAAVGLSPAAVAVGQSSPPIQAQIAVGSPATLVAKGAGVDVPVTASCSGLNVGPGFLVLSITEAVGKNVAYGASAENVDCTGTSQTFDLLVVAQTPGPVGIPAGPSYAFAKGVAIANGTIQACTADGSSCVSATDEPTIKIRK